MFLKRSGVRQRGGKRNEDQYFGQSGHDKSCPCKGGLVGGEGGVQGDGFAVGIGDGKALGAGGQRGRDDG